MFHEKRQQPQQVDETVTVMERNLTRYSRASSKAWRSRKRMTEARTRAEYESAALEHQAALLKAEGEP